MNGLLKSNFYASISNIRYFSGFMILLGSFVVIIDNQIHTLLIGYLLLSMVGFSINAIVCLRKENTSKWGKYTLTTPVRRRDIIKSYFISQLLWLCIGIIIAGICISLSVLLHGFPFDKETDILMVFALGISVSLFMCAFFFPLFYVGGDERSEATLIISVLCAIGIVMGLTSFINWLFGPQMTLVQIVLGALILMCSSVVALALSYCITVSIFKKKQY